MMHVRDFQWLIITVYVKDECVHVLRHIVSGTQGELLSNN